MEILDRVYKTFCNLDRDYARSNKSRSEYIAGKFGGDVNIGSIIILDAVTADADTKSPEDVRKLVFLKEIFAQIKAAGAGIDSVSSFSSLQDSTDMDKLFSVLEESISAGTGVRVVTQAQMVKNTKEAVHVHVTDEGSTFCPIDSSKVLYPYNEHTLGMFATRFRFEGGTPLCQYYEVLNNQSARMAQPEQVMKILSGNGKAAK